MKTMKEVMPRAIKLILIITVLCGVIYPLIVTGISLIFKDKANGSMIEVDGIKYGSELLGQQYTGDEYLWGRIMNIDTKTFQDENGNAVMYATPSNINTTSEEFETLVAKRVEKIKNANPDATVDKIPVDLVTSSGSGMDPNISVAAATYQVERIAKSRNMTPEEVRSIIDKYSTDRFLGIFGEEVVNVLEVNLALDGILK
jgi:K+-transporting ATPase ATPase C chain